MNTQTLRSLLSRQNIVPFTCFFLLIVVIGFGLMHSSATAGGGSGQVNQRPPMPSVEELKRDFDDEDLKTKDDKPAGKWTYGTLLDSNQTNDPTVPVYVRSVQIVSGGGKYRGIHKIKRVEVTNKTSLTVVSLQVRVEVVRFYEPEKILLENELPFINVTVDPNSSKVVEITTIRPPQLLKALAENGELSGDFRIRISMQAVRFEDGSFWRRRPNPTALLDSPYLNQPLGLRFPDIASLADHIPAPHRSSDTKQPDMARCIGEPGLAASAFSFVRFEYDTCSDNSDVRIDPTTGKKDCGNPGTGACYAHCSDDGWCSTWESPDTCAGPTATPPTGTCPWPPPAPCCEPDYTIPGTCRWDCRPPNCSAETRFADGCISQSGPVVCDEGYTFTANQTYGAACCPATPTPTPETCAEDCAAVYGPRWFCYEGVCTEQTPVLVDVEGDGFALTDAAGGVDFALEPGGARRRFAWTEAGSDDAWLALDRNGNGQIDSAQELFGNFTPQPATNTPPNGFIALSVFDGSDRGGNGDGKINKQDSIFRVLWLWQDANHNGISEAGELHTLKQLGLKSIDLDYKESKRTDQHGNHFKYRAKVKDTRDAQLGRWAWDVVLVAGP